MKNKKTLFEMLRRPEVYEPSRHLFWADEYLSQLMLQPHLNPDSDGASRTHDFIDCSAQWIGSLVAPATEKRLLDLGCAPGLYTERFHHQGFTVLGVDISRQSIEYAKTHTDSAIHYTAGDYLTLDFPDEIDLATIIYCDFGVLSPAARAMLLRKAFAALKPGGKFVLDVFSRRQYAGFAESSSITENPSGGFWSPEAHILLERRLAYPEEHTYLHQAVVVTTNELKYYHIWEHVFTRRELEKALHETGFQQVEWVGDIAGAPAMPHGKSICAVAHKPCSAENNMNGR